MPDHPDHDQDDQDDQDEDRPPALDANAVVSYNLRAIRRRRGWTQQEVAIRLGHLSGHQLPQASISAMERGMDGERRRRFDAHELYLFSVVFAVPMAYFFVPPPDEAAPGRVLAGTGRPLCWLYAAFLGRLDQLLVLDERLGLLELGGTTATDAAIEVVFGTGGGAQHWYQHYRHWRDDRAHQMAGRWGEDLQRATAVLARFVAEVAALRPEAFLAGPHRNGAAGAGHQEAGDHGSR